MLMLVANLGEEYVVWDKAGSIRYRKPGKGRVRAEFRLTEERLAEIRAAVEADGRYDARFLVEIKDEVGWDGCGGGAGDLLRDEDCS